MFETINPRETIAVTTRAETNLMGKTETRDNILILDWHMPASINPPMYAIAVRNDHHTIEMLRKSGAFVINVIPFEMKEQIIFCGQVSGRHVDKFKHAKLLKEEAESIEGVRIKDCLSYLECRVEQEIPLGDHVIFIGQVLLTYHNKAGKKLYHLRGDKFTTTIEQ